MQGISLKQKLFGFAIVVAFHRLCSGAPLHKSHLDSVNESGQMSMQVAAAAAAAVDEAVEAPDAAIVVAASSHQNGSCALMETMALMALMALVAALETLENYGTTSTSARQSALRVESIRFSLASPARNPCRDARILVRC